MNAFLRGEDSLLIGQYYRRLNAYLGRYARSIENLCQVVLIIIILLMAGVFVYAMFASIENAYDSDGPATSHNGAQNCTNTTADVLM